MNPHLLFLISWFLIPSCRNLLIFKENNQHLYFSEKTKLAPIKARFETPPSPVDEIVTKMAEQAGVPVLARVDNSEQCSQKGKEEEMRKKRCIVADHVFALVVFLANAILHLSFFCPYM